MAKMILAIPDCVGPLLEIALNVEDQVSCRAWWVLEFTARENLSILYPHLNHFTSNLGRVHLDSAVRPVAKICEYLIKSNFSNAISGASPALKEEHLARITTACFDWLISDQKVAPQAYSMTCLLLLGKKFDWVHPELKMLLEQNYALGSAAYKARARMTLAKLK